MATTDNADGATTNTEGKGAQNCCTSANAKMSGLPADKLNLAFVACQGAGTVLAILTTVGLVISDVGFDATNDYSILLYCQIAAVFCAVPWFLKEWKDKENPFAACCPCANTPEQRNCACSIQIYLS